MYVYARHGRVGGSLASHCCLELDRRGVELTMLALLGGVGGKLCHTLTSRRILILVHVVPVCLHACFCFTCLLDLSRVMHRVVRLPWLNHALDDRAILAQASWARLSEPRPPSACSDYGMWWHLSAVSPGDR